MAPGIREYRLNRTKEGEKIVMKRNITFLLVTALLLISAISVINISYAAGDVKVQMFNSNTTATTNSISPKIKLINQSSSAISLSTVTIRYYYTVDGDKAQSFWCDYAAITSPAHTPITSNVTGKFVKMSTAVTGADYYLEIGFTSGAGSLAAGATVEIQSRFAKTDWTNYTQNNDYSFNPSATNYADTAKVTAYTSGTLASGTEPDGSTQPTVTSTPTAITVTPTPVITETPVSTATPRRTATPERTATPRTASPTPVRSATSTPTPIIIPTPTPSPVPTPTPTVIVGTSKVMPLGDSITDGLVVPGGYRIKLWRNIMNNGLTVDFVGSQSNGPAELGDKNHEGHSGWRIDQIDTNINGWMDTYKPKLVLLHIGTNDIGQNYNLSSAPTRLSALIDKICAKLPAGGKLYVAKLVPLNGQDTNINNFNAQIPGIVQSKVNSGKPVYMVDMSVVTKADLADGVHPNQTGYDKMADVWFSAIRNDLN
jgi:lysophospholipase L1-like esterase